MLENCGKEIAPPKVDICWGLEVAWTADIVLSLDVELD